MANIYNELKVFLKANYVPINSGVVIQPQKNKIPVFQNQNNNVNGIINIILIKIYSLYL